MGMFNLQMLIAALALQLKTYSNRVLALSFVMKACLCMPGT